ncbi:MAG: DUF456 domain-containing protein [Deltaproteobacteria bacterium]|nr:DUF456 domain-containing protein [Deltaproteobacteria bacterium]
MTALHIFLTILLFAIMILSTLSIVFGMPGTLISFIAVLLFVLITKAQYIGWTTVIVLALLTLLGELGELLFGIKDAAKAGVSRKAVFVSILSGIAGAVVLAPFLLGIGALIGAALGTFTGAFVVSIIESRHALDAAHKGWVSAIGRLKGTIFKGLIAIIMLIICIIEII